MLCIEVFANFIQDSPKILEFLLLGSGDLQAKVRLYADDTTLLFKDSRLLASLLVLIVLFERGTGAKHNSSKTRTIWLWAWKFCNGASCSHLGSQDDDSGRCFGSS